MRQRWIHSVVPNVTAIWQCTNDRWLRVPRGGGALTRRSWSKSCNDHVAFHAHGPAPAATWPEAPPINMTIGGQWNAHSMRSPRDSPINLIVKLVSIFCALACICAYVLTLFLNWPHFELNLVIFIIGSPMIKDSALLYVIMNLSLQLYHFRCKKKE